MSVQDNAGSWLPTQVWIQNEVERTFYYGLSDSEASAYRKAIDNLRDPWEASSICSCVRCERLVAITNTEEVVADEPGRMCADCILTLAQSGPPEEEPQPIPFCWNVFYLSSHRTPRKRYLGTVEAGTVEEAMLKARPITDPFSTDYNISIEQV